jgi:N-methylhydantoinase A
MAFGGGGPLHACALADDLELTRVVIPRYPGLFSALGLLVAGVRASLARSFVAPVTDADVARARGIAAALERDARAQLRAQRIDDADITVAVELDVRYAGQSFDLIVPFDGDAGAVANAFHARHERRYGYAARDERVEIAAIRVTAAGAGGAMPAFAPATERTGAVAPLGTRRAWDGGAFVEAAIYERDALPPGAVVTGPAIVEQYDTTTWIPSAWTATVDAHANLRLERTNA